MTTPTDKECHQHNSHFHPLRSQAGGHVEMKVLNTKYVCKPLNQREHKFYQIIPAKLKNFVPCYVGTMTVEDSDSKEYLVMDNVAQCFQKPCVLDLKMGTRMYSDFATESKIQSQTRKSLLTTSSSLGVRFCGSQKYDSANDTFEKVDKYVGRDADLLQLSNLLTKFFTSGGALQKDVIQCVLDEIKSMKKVLITLDHLRLYASSLLIVYEGLDITDHDNDHIEHDKNQTSVKVKIIDFANAALPEDDVVHLGPDHGFIHGLESLKNILEVLLFI